MYFGVYHTQCMQAYQNEKRNDVVFVMLPWPAWSIMFELKIYTFPIFTVLNANKSSIIFVSFTICTAYKPWVIFIWSPTFKLWCMSYHDHCQMDKKYFQHIFGCMVWYSFSWPSKRTLTKKRLFHRILLC